MDAIGNCYFPLHDRRGSSDRKNSSTLLAASHGTAIGILPARVMQDELARRTVKLVRVLPKVPAHRVSICYQISEFGPGLKVLVDLTRELVAQFPDAHPKAGMNSKASSHSQVRGGY